MNLFMRKMEELENQYNIDKQALREARIEIQRAEEFAKKHDASAIVSVWNGNVKVWVSGDEDLSNIAVATGYLCKEQIAGRWVYEVEGVKVLEWRS